MRKTTCILSVAVLMISACQQKSKMTPIDYEAAKVNVVSILDKFHSSMFNKDANNMISLSAENGLYLGTDSKEFFDKPTTLNMMTQMFADPTMEISYSIDKREVRIAEDGTSAIAIDQFVMRFISQNIPVRWIFHLVKTGDIWLIDFSSLSLIPNNEDLGKLNMALE